VTPGSPSFFAAGFRCLRKRFLRSKGNPSRVANTRAFGSAAAGQRQVHSLAYALLRLNGADSQERIEATAIDKH